jgi:spore coat protein U-like protein
MNTFNKNKRPLIAFALTAAVGLGVVSNVSQVVAATDTQNLNVTASITNKCKLANPVDVAFGAYDPVVTNAVSPLDANGSFDVKCTKGGSGVLSIGNGANYSSPNRRMTDGSSNYLIYDLYTTTGRTVVWNATNTVTYGPASNASNFTETVYGRIPGAQLSAVAGSYSDVVVVTVTY